LSAGPEVNADELEEDAVHRTRHPIERVTVSADALRLLGVVRVAKAVRERDAWRLAALQEAQGQRAQDELLGLHLLIRAPSGWLRKGLERPVQCPRRADRVRHVLVLSADGDPPAPPVASGREAATRLRPVLELSDLPTIALRILGWLRDPRRSAYAWTVDEIAAGTARSDSRTRYALALLLRAGRVRREGAPKSLRRDHSPALQVWRVAID
jgi:hypothetical protein